MARPPLDLAGQTFGSLTAVLHRGIGTAKKCRSCGQRIMFARTTVGRVGPFEEDHLVALSRLGLVTHRPKIARGWIARSPDMTGEVRP